MDEQARGLAGKLVHNTPPFSNRRRGNAARSAGKKTVEVQVNRVLQGVHPARAKVKTDGDVRQAHERARVKGVIRKGRQRQKIKAGKGLLKKYIRRRQAKVGMLAAGWNKAADKFNVSSRMRPAWVKAHNPRSSASLKVRPDLIVAKFSNKVRFGKDVDILKKRFDRTLKWQAEANNRKMANYLGTALKNGSRKAGWKFAR